MASKTFNMKFFALLISSFAIIQMTIAGDPDILTNFIVPPNVTDVNGDFFTITGMHALLGGFPTFFKVTKASLAEFPALNGQSVSYAVLEFLAGTRDGGTLQAGFVDITNTLFNKTLQMGYIFVFPKGLMHFQYNDDVKFPAIAVSAFGSANAGTISLPNTLFTTGIDNNVLAKSFKTDIATIKALKAGLAPQP
ncbi:hypothetical protein SO802_019234 [Lithocarpus litseifolius]|uniref:Germin-like protein n=1 Tax=Lithocarpus litseifolius TaxID=425828 RepID=A0AAW2CN47_9ROSI